MSIDGLVLPQCSSQAKSPEMFQRRLCLDLYLRHEEEKKKKGILKRIILTPHVTDSLIISSYSLLRNSSHKIHFGILSVKEPVSKGIFNGNHLCV